MYKLMQGDCMELLEKIPDKSVDLILCDLPYGITACKWDSIIPLNDYLILNNKYYELNDWLMLSYIRGETHKEALKYFKENKHLGLWSIYNRIIKDNGAIVLFGTEPFATKLRMSNINNYKYDWIWQKENGTNFATVKYQPFRKTERIIVFGNFATSYNKKRPKNYNPQFTYDIPYKIRRKEGQREQLNKGANKVTEYTNDDGKRYPTDIIYCQNEKGYHPTQKPVALLEYLIKTYTNENEIVLDNCMGSGSTGVAAVNLNRHFIGIELEPKYFKIAEQRISDAFNNNN